MRVFNAIQQVYLEKHGYIQDLEKSLGKDVIKELLNLNIIIKINGHDSWKFNEENEWTCWIEEFNKIEDQFNKDIEASRVEGYKVMINEIKSEISKIK